MFEGFQGNLNWALMMTRDASFSHSCTPDRCSFHLSDETIRILNFHFSRKPWWKNCWKLLKCLRCQKADSFQTIKDIDSKFWLKTWIKMVSKFHVPILYTFRKISFSSSEKKLQFFSFFQFGWSFPPARNHPGDRVLETVRMSGKLDRKNVNFPSTYIYIYSS